MTERDSITSLEDFIDFLRVSPESEHALLLGLPCLILFEEADGVFYISEPTAGVFLEVALKVLEHPDGPPMYGMLGVGSEYCVLLPCAEEQCCKTILFEGEWRAEYIGCEWGARADLLLRLQGDSNPPELFTMSPLDLIARLEGGLGNG